ncbi:MAG: Ger(x)C family spore germination protein [Bacillota bacterium]
MEVKRTLGLLLALSLLLIPGGCWSRDEIEKLSIVKAVGLDLVNIGGRAKWQVSHSIIQPANMGHQAGQQGGGQGQKPEWLVVGLGDTIREAERNNSTRNPRRDYLDHLFIYVVGEKVAREGMHIVIGTWMREPGFRLRPWLLVAEGQAMDILAAEPELERTLASEIAGIIENGLPVVSKGYALPFKDFALQLATPGQDAVAARVELSKPRGGEQPAAGGPEADRKAVRINGMAVFRKDRLAGWMKDRETLGYLYVIGEVREAMIPLKLPWYRRDDVSISMTGSRSKIKARVEGGRVTMFIDIVAEGELAEVVETNEIANPDTIDLVERELAREIRSLAEDSIRQAQQEFRADIFGFGHRLRKVNPGAWKAMEENWYDIYPTVEVVLNVKTTVRGTGMTVNTPGIR